jgi:hypothetical protein
MPELLTPGAGMAREDYQRERFIITTGFYMKR